MMQNILLATDGSAPAKRAADLAAALSLRFGSKVVVLHAYHPVPHFLGQPFYGEALTLALQEAQVLVDDAAQHLHEMGVTEVIKDVLEGPAAEAILHAVETRKPDLVVLGARGLSTWQGVLLGSVSTAVSHRAECPVLIVK